VVVTVQQLAVLVHGQVHGDGNRVIRDARPLSEAGADHITFVEKAPLARHLKSCQASAVLTSSALLTKYRDAAGDADFTFIEVDDPFLGFIALMRFFRGEPAPRTAQVSPHAYVHPTAVIGEEATIEPFAVIEEGAVLGARCRIGSGTVVSRHCSLGDDVILHPHVVLYDGTVLGNRVEIHSSVVIGADGFGYRFQDGKHVKVPQFGIVEVGDDVEIGAGTKIDRGTFQNTRIGAGTKIDNLVQIGHNCQIGKHNLLISQVGIAGSTSTGDYVVLAGQVGVADHLHIGDRAVIGARSGLFRDVPAGERMLGTPARPEGEQKRILLSVERLPDLRREVRQIRQHLGLETGHERESA
jgi:UDP-3-O-[3-hydroxymyristoyl] glucosamine N-acyltransferase